MEQHISLHKSLDESSKECDLTSWTKHVNRRGIVYTIRFAHKAAILDPRDQDSDASQNRITYKPKSRYHAKRDHMRIKEFNNNHLKSFCDKNMYTDDFVMNHSETVPIQINQNSSHLTTHFIATSEHETSCLSEHSQPMSSDSQSHISPIEIHHAPETQILSPVELESIDHVLPPVQLQFASVSQPVHLAYAESISPLWPPRTHQPDTVVTVSISRENDATMPSMSSDDIFPAEYEIDSSPDFSTVLKFPYTDFTTYHVRENLHSHSNPTISAIEPSNKNFLCDECATTVPSIINMLFCDSCSFHSCGNCVLSGNSDFHSSNCRGTLSFMSDDKMQEQYVPTSRDRAAAVVLEMSQPPGSRNSDSDEQRVPTNNDHNFYNPLKFVRL